MDWDLNRGIALATLTPLLPLADRCPVLTETLNALDHYLPTDVVSVVREATAAVDLGEAATLFLRLLPAWQLNTGRWASAEDSRKSYVSASFFANVALAQSPETQGNSLARAVSAAIEIEDAKFRREALQSISPVWKTRLQTEPGEAYRTLGMLLRSSSNRQRAQLFTDLAALMPVLVTLGSQDTAIATARAIQQIGNWWP